MKLTLGFSPCPNDTFMFDAMIHGKIDTEGLDFEVHMADVEELNQLAFKQQLDITKLSYHAFAHLVNHYILLDAGSALGNNCGPLLISKRPIKETELNDARIAIPGKFTTANFLLSLAYPNAQNKQEVLFSEIENLVLNDQVDAGLIIHENRFTYHERGLQKIIDLGEYWETTTQMPIPLGGIVAKRNLDDETILKINRVMKKSVEFAFANPEVSRNFIQLHAQEMDNQVVSQHINLYVNEYSIDLGTKGRAAIQKLFDVAIQKKVIPTFQNELFVSS